MVRIKVPRGTGGRGTVLADDGDPSGFSPSPGLLLLPLSAPLPPPIPLPGPWIGLGIACLCGTVGCHCSLGRGLGLRTRRVPSLGTAARDKWYPLRPQFPLSQTHIALDDAIKTLPGPRPTKRIRVQSLSSTGAGEVSRQVRANVSQRVHRKRMNVKEVKDKKAAWKGYIRYLMILRRKEGRARVVVGGKKQQSRVFTRGDIAELWAPLAQSSPVAPHLFSSFDTCDDSKVMSYETYADTLVSETEMAGIGKSLLAEMRDVGIDDDALILSGGQDYFAVGEFVFDDFEAEEEIPRPAGFLNLDFEPASPEKVITNHETRPNFIQELFKMTNDSHLFATSPSQTTGKPQEANDWDDIMDLFTMVFGDDQPLPATFLGNDDEEAQLPSYTQAAEVIGQDDVESEETEVMGKEGPEVLEAVGEQSGIVPVPSALRWAKPKVKRKPNRGTKKMKVHGEEYDQDATGAGDERGGEANK